MGAFVTMELIALKTSQNRFVDFDMGHHVTNFTVKTAISVLFLVKLADQSHLVVDLAKGGRYVEFFSKATLAKFLGK